MGSDLRDLLASLDPAAAIDARDAALLVLGWAAALRRSELVGLDWHELGSGSGFVQIRPRGLVVTLPTSKGAQEEAVEIVIPCPDMHCLRSAGALGARCQAATGRAGVSLDQQGRQYRPGASHRPQRRPHRQDAIGAAARTLHLSALT